MHRSRAVGIVSVVVLTSLFGVGACGGKILQGSDAPDSGTTDGSIDATAPEATPPAVCDSIEGSTKPTGSAKGFFYPGSPIFVSSSIQGFAVGDVNGDGRSDLILSSDALEVFLQNACGGFDAPQSYPGGYGRLAIGDVTRDGRSDVIAVDLSNGGFAVRPQKPDGTLDAPFSYTVQDAQGTKAVGGAPILGRFDRDQHLDVFTGDSLGSLYLQRGEGLTLGPLLTMPDGGAGVAFATGDFDGDGRDDIVGSTPDALVTFLQQNDGTFKTVVNAVAFHDYPPLSIAVGDFDGDHHDDVAVEQVTPPNGSALAVFPQVDAGVFGAPQLLSTQFADALASADVDGDDRSDIVGAHGTFHVFLQSSPGQLTEMQSSFGYSYGPLFLLADVDGDGKPDLVSVTEDFDTNRMTLLLAYHAP